MKKYISFLFLLTFIIPSIAFASWWNPFSWFKKQATQPPVIQVSIPTPTTIDNNQDKKEEKIKKESTGCDSDKGFNTVTGAPCSNKKISTVKNTTTKITPVVDNLAAEKVKIKLKEEAEQKQLLDLSNERKFNEVILPITPKETTTTPVASPSIAAIDAFLANPTADNFNTFCTIAKTLEGVGERQVLNDTRTEYVIKKNTLYQGVPECAYSLNEYKTGGGNTASMYWINYNPLDLIDLNNSSESDAIRELKINYNTYWKSLSIYKLIGFAYIQNNKIISPKQMIENLDPNTKRVSSIYRKINNLFIIPEQTLSSLRKTLIRN